MNDIILILSILVGVGLIAYTLHRASKKAEEIRIAQEKWDRVSLQRIRDRADDPSELKKPGTVEWVSTGGWGAWDPVCPTCKGIGSVFYEHRSGSYTESCCDVCRVCGGTGKKEYRV